VRSACLSFLILLLPCHGLARAQTKPTTQSGDFELHEWVVLVCSVNQPVANSASAFKNTMPTFVSARRPDAPPGSRQLPMPAGVIRIIGGSDRAAKIDVLLQLKSGRFISHWPEAQMKSDRLLWADMQLSASAPPQVSSADPDHWFTKLRAGQSTYLVATGEKNKGSDRMLVYDAEIPITAPLKVQADSAGESSYRIVNTSDAPLHDLELYKPADASGCRTAYLPQLDPAKPKPATKPATTASAPKPEDVFASVSTKPATQAATQPATRPTTIASTTQPTGQLIKLAPASGAAAQAIASAWKSRLDKIGLEPNDVELICSILAQYAIDGNHLTAIYQLDAAEMDRLLPLEVVPAPRKTMRIGLVIVKDVDPAIAQEVAALVKKLGDDDWSAREAASKSLAEIGASAKPQLESAAKSNDPEVAARAERLLAALSKTTGTPQP
jgi:hypothetical protein